MISLRSIPKQNLISGGKAAPLLLAAALLSLVSTDALAYVQFQKEFQKLYAGRDNKEFRTIARKAKCFTCHQGEDNDHKFNNRYGQALAPFLGKDDRKDKEKIIKALEEVAEMPSDAADPDSPTFGELIKAGDLPGGSLEDSKKDPEGVPTSEIKDKESESE